MTGFLRNKYNPNPITKMIVVCLLGFTLMHPLNQYFEIGVVVIGSIFFFINGFIKDAIKNIIFYLFLCLAPNFHIIAHFPFVIKLFLSLLFVIRMFYLPFMAGKFFIKTSDVGSIISSMDKLKVPSCVSIPIAVMFRYFPSFQEERKNIKLALKIRGINCRNPIAYLEYVAVPLLVISSNIAEDISKAAETKCIENPIRKNRYTRVGLHVIDLIYFGTMFLCLVGGWIW